MGRQREKNDREHTAYLKHTVYLNKHKCSASEAPHLAVEGKGKLPPLSLVQARYSWTNSKFGKCGGV